VIENLVKTNFELKISNFNGLSIGQKRQFLQRFSYFTTHYFDRKLTLSRSILDPVNHLPAQPSLKVAFNLNRGRLSRL